MLITKSLLTRVGEYAKKHQGPLWLGPSDYSQRGGITQSMIGGFLACRERFRIKYVLGLSPSERWSKTFGYGNMWHICEELHAAQKDHVPALLNYCIEEKKKYPMDRDEISKWQSVCLMQFPEYVNYWRNHPDMLHRVSLLEEEVFHVPHHLPSGRVVYLRGKFDSVDRIGDYIWLQENKTKGDVDEAAISTQLTFDLQTMLYLLALRNYWQINHPDSTVEIKGVRYNVIRRPFSGGKGNIRPHAAKSTKTKFTPAETYEEMLERLRVDYILDDPRYWFFRINSEVSDSVLHTFLQTCLNPILEQICYWYDEATGNEKGLQEFGPPPMNFRMPYGIYNPLTERGSTAYDSFLDAGSYTGMGQTRLFPELEPISY